MLGRALAVVLVVMGMVPRVVGADVDALREELWDALAKDPLRAVPGVPLIYRTPEARAADVFRLRADSVVLVAARDRFGGGAVLTADGDVVTTEHVLQAAHRARGQEWVLVAFRTEGALGKEHFVPAQVVHRASRHDLALLRLSRTPGALRAVPLAPTPAFVGQDVFAIGHAPSFFWTLTRGMVAQTLPDFEWSAESGRRRVAALLHVQLPLSDAGSGSPLLDAHGRLLGVLVAQGAGAGGLSLAVDVRHVRDLLRDARSLIRP